MDQRFSFKTIKNFDKHIENSIRGYNDLVSDILAISDYFVEADTNIYDVGCSTGKLIKSLSKKHPTSSFIGIEREVNFNVHFLNAGNLRYEKQDFLQMSGLMNASMIVSVFTLQFFQQHKRITALKKIYDCLNYGSAFVFCEKMLSETSKLQDILSFLYYDHKRESFSDKEILDKEKDLRSQMKSFTMSENIDILKAVGFRKIEVFWKRYNFTGILAIK